MSLASNSDALFFFPFNRRVSSCAHARSKGDVLLADARRNTP